MKTIHDRWRVSEDEGVVEENSSWYKASIVLLCALGKWELQMNSLVGLSRLLRWWSIYHLTENDTHLKFLLSITYLTSLEWTTLVELWLAFLFLFIGGWCSVSKFAREKIRPQVTEMDEKERVPQHLIEELFDNGVIIVTLYEILDNRFWWHVQIRVKSFLANCSVCHQVEHDVICPQNDVYCKILCMMCTILTRRRGHEAGVHVIRVYKNFQKMSFCKQAELDRLKWPT